MTDEMTSSNQKNCFLMFLCSPFTAFGLRPRQEAARHNQEENRVFACFCARLLQPLVYAQDRRRLGIIRQKTAFSLASALAFHYLCRVDYTPMNPFRPIHTNNCARFGLVSVPEISDERGLLCVADPQNHPFPFNIKRAFWIRGVPQGQTRGQHAHRTCGEVVIPVCGSFTAHVTDGVNSADFVMDNPACGLHIPPMVWCSFTDYSQDCVCLCLTSEPFDKEGYIHDFNDFIKEVCP